MVQEFNDGRYTSIIHSQRDINMMINPLLVFKKEEKINKLISLIEAGYHELKDKQYENHINDNISFSFNHNIFIFNKEDKSIANTRKSPCCKIYSILPNINFELGQIKNLSFSNTQLNNYLVKRSYENDTFDPNKQLRSGFFTMSQEHRLIALKNDTLNKKHFKQSQSIKHILFGIWLNLKDENPSSKKIDLDRVINKYKGLIYSKCLEFVQLTADIDTVYSPSPDQGIFLLVIFYKAIQCHYEVTIIPNEEDKCFSSPYDNESDIFPHELTPTWLIIKNKYYLKESEEITIDLKTDALLGKVKLMNDYLSKKSGIDLRGSMVKSIKSKNMTPSKSLTHNNLKDNLNEIFDSMDLEIDDMDDLYNYPLKMPDNFNTKKQAINPDIDNDLASSDKNEIVNQCHMNKNQNNAKFSRNIEQNISSKTTFGKTIEDNSHSSSNNNSNKLSSTMSKKSLNQTTTTQDSIHNQYTSIINKQAETIQNLQNKVKTLESSILQVLNQLSLLNTQSDQSNQSNQPCIELLKTPTKSSVSKPKSTKNKQSILLQTNQALTDNLHETSIKIPSIRYNSSIFYEEENE